MTLPRPKRATGSHLYKYASPTHLDWLKVIIHQHELYLPNLKELNDPADGLPRLAAQSEDQIVSFLYDEFVARNPVLTREALEDEAKIIRFNVRRHGSKALHPHEVQAFDTEFQDFRIYSLTKRYDKMNLWAYYAAGHRGYCLEFANEGPLFEHAKDVTYLAPENMEIPITDPAIRNGDFFFCKTLDWAGEEEVRLVGPRGYGSKVKFDPSWLTRVILGKDMSDADRKLIQEWAKQREPELVVVNAYYDPLDRAIKLRA
jgi:hypothetical protein